jgi:3-hydroxyisobutyrate dehydrogenase-like beta-hydroxyacid dehydrogenase
MLQKKEFQMSEKIGFIGIGNMGLPMASRLMDQGYDLTVFDIREEAMLPLVKRGARGASDPLDVASQVQTVLISLPSPEVVEEVAVGEKGILNGSSVKFYVDFSTTGRKVAERVAKELGRKDILVLDAPVSGGVTGAENGTLTLMVSGPSQAFKKLLSLLQIIGKNVVHVDEKHGAAQTIKTINNLLSATALAITSEAFVLGVKAGLSSEVMLSVFNSSSGRNSATEDKFPKSILPRTFDFGFTTELAYKDIKLCLEQAEDLGVPMWVGNTVRQLWGYIMSQGGGPKDFTTIIQYIESWAGVEVVGFKKK